MKITFNKTNLKPFIISVIITSILLGCAINFLWDTNFAVFLIPISVILGFVIPDFVDKYMFKSK